MVAQHVATSQPRHLISPTPRLLQLPSEQGHVGAATSRSWTQTAGTSESSAGARSSLPARRRSGPAPIRSSSPRIRTPASSLSTSPAGRRRRSTASFLAELPVRAVLDGELVALDDDGKPDFPLLCEC